MSAGAQTMAAPAVRPAEHGTTLTLAACHKYLIVACLLALPVSRFFKFKLLGSELTISDGFWLANAALFALTVATSLRVPKAFFFLLPLPAAALASFFINIHQSNPIVPFSYLMKVVLVASVIVTRQYIGIYLRATIVSGVAMALLSLFFTDGMGLDVTVETPMNRNEVAHYLILPSVLSVMLFRAQRGGLSLSKFAYAAAGTTMMSVILLSSSRGAALSVIITAILFAAARFNIKALVLIIGVTAALYQYRISGDEYEAKRYEGIVASDIAAGELNTSADRRRYNNIMLGIEFFLSSPVVGTGPGSFKKLDPDRKVMHNTYASTLSETGLLGMTALFLLAAYPAMAAIREIRRTRGPTAISFYLFAMIASFINGLTIEVLPKYPVYFAVAFVLVGVLNNRAARLEAAANGQA